MVISIRKLQHLASSIKNKPHKYIIYQTIFVVFFKLAQMTSTAESVLKGELFSQHFPYLCVLDVISTPVNIQLSYLLCNKRTLTDVRKKLTLRNIYRMIFKKSTVEPSLQYVDGTTAAPPT
ncbi:unnamed protein product [Caenorhabditis nigoni]